MNPEDTIPEAEVSFLNRDHTLGDPDHAILEVEVSLLEGSFWQSRYGNPSH